MSENDELIFSDSPPAKTTAMLSSWNVLIVDDDPMIHKVIDLALNNFIFENKGLNILHAYSAEEALDCIVSTPDIALVFLDVVMETQNSGLELVRKIREVIVNSAIRIVLCTGQPGSNHENDIIINYDINDYLEKSELSAQKLYAVTISSLRSYRDLLKLEESRQALLKANEKLTREQERIQITLNSIADAVLTTDNNGLLTHMNPAAVSLTGWDVNEAIGLPLSHSFKLIDSQTRAPIELPLIKDLSSSSATQKNQALLIGKTGVEYLVANKASPIRNHEGNILGAIIVCRDITIENQFEQALRRTQKMQAISQLTGGIAHDFNNQLGIIVGYLDFLKDFTANDKSASKWVEVSNRAALRCTDLTRQLLSFSRKHNNSKSIIDVNSKLTELQAMLTRSITPNINVEYSLADDLWPVEVDPQEFQDVILNLVLNAKDAMPDGGKLIIETRNKTLDADYPQHNPDALSGNFIQVVVSDTGIGIDKTELERVFEPFYTTKHKSKGGGLGLSMVYGFTQRVKGFINIYSEPGTGTTIRLYLPCTSVSDIESKLESNSQSTHLSGHETILIVDDETDLLHLAKQYLEDFGYKTYAAENATQALKVLEQQPDVDCLFSDIVMPGGINGFELAQKTIDKYPNLKVLLTSGFTSKSIAQNGPSHFSANILSKPYQKVELAQRLRLILDENITS